MAEAAKLKEEGIRSGGGGGAGSAIASALGKLGEYPKRWRGFLHEVRVEMRQVTWPTRHEVLVTTWVVIVTVAFFGVFFFGVDTGVGWFVQRVIRFFTKR